ncbi:sigma 54-interacting transcriptional regulator [Herbaspirillum sp. RTI4]|nr:sigma 54-interacting transcriptional regulator [Herbaspirillum sp. RTI4]MDY7577975.1 sigma 54-interacting transcriptional regulator [Herbaspirillum sp. RTI4]MEA9983446.1 sigma 54-interacting transcriptional regulator [Herbaspirillum sp. RTI4]
MHTLIERGKRLIDHGIPILLLGETGTGKEYLSRALHAYSARRDAGWVAVNCASIPESLAESELFGYSKGAFSGALPGGMKGKVQQADGGTLFLDEIGDMPFSLQTRFLRVLSEREVIPLGAAQPVSVDLQLICATHQDLHVLVAQGRFRQDLYYRIAGGILRLPALRERADARSLIMQMIADELGLPRPDEDMISASALQRLLRCSWPGNLRQLHAVVRYCCAVMNGAQIESEDLPEELMPNELRLNELRANELRLNELRPNDLMPNDLMPNSQTDTAAGLPPMMALVEPQPLRAEGALGVERSRVIDALVGSRWNISAASRQLGMCRASLYRKLRQLDIPHVRDQSGLVPAYAMP